jgi:hypothetical protein
VFSLDVEGVPVNGDGFTKSRPTGPVDSCESHLMSSRWVSLLRRPLASWALLTSGRERQRLFYIFSWNDFAVTWPHCLAIWRQLPMN